MSRPVALILLGVLIVLAPFAGFPAAFTGALTPLLGIIVALLGLAERNERVRRTSESGAPPPPESPAA